MIIFSDRFYNREAVAADRARYYVFGDNTAGNGNAGQACIRGLHNAIGLPTKWYPTMEANAMFSDHHYDHAGIENALWRIATHLIQGHLVIIPVATDGRTSIGAGLSKLPERAPHVYLLINEQIKQMAQVYGFHTECVQRVAMAVQARYVG